MSTPSARRSENTETRASGFFTGPAIGVAVIVGTFLLGRQGSSLTPFPAFGLVVTALVLALSNPARRLLAVGLLFAACLAGLAIAIYAASFEGIVGDS
jgi:hypothetical protein